MDVGVFPANGSVMDCRLLMPLNAESPMLMTEFGTMIEDKLEAPKKV